MHLTNLIDLIAEVAAKRVAGEGKPKEDTPDAVMLLCRTIRATGWRGCHNFIRFCGFRMGLDRRQRPLHPCPLDPTDLRDAR